MYQQKNWLYFSLLIIGALVIIVVVSVFRRGGEPMEVQVAKLLLDIGSGDDSSVLPVVDKLVADFNGQPGLAEALWQMSQEYYNKAVRKYREGLKEQATDYYRKAITLKEKIIQELPFSDLVPKAYYTAAVIYSQELHEYKKGIEYYQKVVDNWPDYRYAADAQYSIGRYYERLRSSGGMSAAEANPKIEAAYQAVVEKYPDSDEAKYAPQKLEQMRHKKVSDSYRRNE